MADNIEHLMLEQFRQQRGLTERLFDEVREIKAMLLSSRFQQRGLELTTDALSDSLATVKTRLDRIERRLDLVDAEGK